MAVRHAPIGLDHPTTVPANFDPAEPSADEGAETWEGEDHFDESLVSESEDRSDESLTPESDAHLDESQTSSGSK